ncbi:hypothetical protein Ais01nite_56580 [Asanoa ishikariensis]|nr:hypothetical protein Ais01nite_56580 [Asanoa ishikariensis]
MNWSSTLRTAALAQAVTATPWKSSSASDRRVDVVGPQRRREARVGRPHRVELGGGQVGSASRTASSPALWGIGMQYIALHASPDVKTFADR